MMIWERVVHVQLFICKTEIAEIFRAKCLLLMEAVAKEMNV